MLYGTSGMLRWLCVVIAIVLTGVNGWEYEPLCGGESWQGHGFTM